MSIDPRTSWVAGLASRWTLLVGLAVAAAAVALIPLFRAQRERSGGDLSILYMDLDHFKAVNDKFGHAVGDAVLRMFADRVSTRS